MRQDQRLAIKLVDGRSVLLRLRPDFDQRPVLSRIIVDLSFYQGRKHRYGFRVGPSDEDGRISVDYDGLEERRLSNLKHQPWDYKTPLQSLDDRLFVSVPTYEELEDAFRINKTFNGGTADDYAYEWLSSNNAKIRADGRFVTLSGKETRCSLRCYPTR